MVEKRMRRWEVRQPRFLTFSCYQRLPLLGRAEWRDAFVESLGAARDRLGFRLIAWVVMPEHVHLIVVPGERPIPDVLRAIKQPVAQRAIRRWKEKDAKVLRRIEVGEGRHRYWQAGGGFDRNLRDQDDLAEKVAYVHHNPVKRGLVERATDWRWSSARWYAGERDGVLTIDPVG